jgi:hypothetical protein
VARHDPLDVPRAVFNGGALGSAGTWGEGQCRRCLMQLVSEGYKTCPSGLDTGEPKPFWVGCDPKHGRQCYCRHLTVGAVQQSVLSRSQNSRVFTVCAREGPVMNVWYACLWGDRRPQTKSRAYVVCGQRRCASACGGGKQPHSTYRVGAAAWGAIRLQQGIKRWSGASISWIISRQTLGKGRNIH